MNKVKDLMGSRGGPTDDIGPRHWTLGGDTRCQGLERSRIRQLLEVWKLVLPHPPLKQLRIHSVEPEHE